MEGSSECAEGGWGGGYSHISSPGKTKLTHVCPEHPNMSLTCPYHVPNMSLICPMYQKYRWCSDMSLICPSDMSLICPNMSLICPNMSLICPMYQKHQQMVF